MKRYHVLLLGLIIVFAISQNTMAQDYEVYGAGTASVNGLYVDTGRTTPPKSSNSAYPEGLTVYENGSYKLGFRG